MKIFDETQMLQRHHPPQTKSANLLDLSISSKFKAIFLLLSVVYIIALNTPFQLDIPLIHQIQLLYSPLGYWKIFNL